ncbi:IS3 family transposase, partial [Ignavibacterium sp.]|uniref:IS3 family transposase n=1 Tax=Ignavibacterium sp. TaxID=2651167 RepID=UPI00307CD7AD
MSFRAKENQRILEIIKFHHNKSKATYGLPRIYAAIRKEGVIVNKKRVSRLMRINNIKAKTKRRFRVTTVQNSKAQASENLLKQSYLWIAKSEFYCFIRK